MFFAIIGNVSVINNNDIYVMYVLLHIYFLLIISFSENIFLLKVIELVYLYQVFTL